MALIAVVIYHEFVAAMSAVGQHKHFIELFERIYRRLQIPRIPRVHIKYRADFRRFVVRHAVHIRLFIRQHNFFAVIVSAVFIIVDIRLFRQIKQSFIARFAVHPQHNFYMQKLALSRIIVIAFYIKIM